jgi:hypothetical protein
LDSISPPPPPHYPPPPCSHASTRGAPRGGSAGVGATRAPPLARPSASTAELAWLARAQPELLLGGSAGSGRRRSELEGEGQSSPCLGRSSLAAQRAAGCCRRPAVGPGRRSVPAELGGPGAGTGGRNSCGGEEQSFMCLGRSVPAARRAAGGGQLWTEMLQTPHVAMCCNSYLVLLQ